MLENAVLGTVMIAAGVLLVGLLADWLQQLITHAILLISNARTANIAVNRLTFIGVVHHELSHALLAFLTGAKVKKVTLFKPDKKKGTLGSVSFVPRGYKFFQGIQQTLASTAPVPCGIASSLLIFRFLLPVCTEMWQYVLALYLLISILLHMNLSTADIRAAAKGAPYVLLIIFTVMLISGYDTITNLRELIERFTVE